MTLLTLWSLKETPYQALAVGASTLSLVASFLLGVLVSIEQRRSIRPSLIAGGYLFLSALLDLAQARSLFLRPSLSPVAAVFCASVSVKFGLLILEEIPKIPATGSKWEKTQPEALGGAMNRSLFWWLNPTFWMGYRRLIYLDDLSNLQKKFDSASLLSRIDGHWNRSDQTRKHGLCLVAMRTFPIQTLAGVPPRLALIGFKFSQPFLIKAIVEFIGSPNRSQFDDQVARGLLGATLLVYVGIAITSCMYLYLTYQLITGIRGALVGLIYKKALSLRAYTDMEALTLMSTDIDGMVSGFRALHDLWACCLEIGIGIYLLYREVGPACFLVFIPIASRFLNKHHRYPHDLTDFWRSKKWQLGSARKSVRRSCRPRLRGMKESKRGSRQRR